MRTRAKADQKEFVLELLKEMGGSKEWIMQLLWKKRSPEAFLSRL